MESGLADFSLRDLLEALWSDVGKAERKTYLQKAPDKANGFYARTVQVGAVPVDVDVPRTLTGKFRPASLPGPISAANTDESQTLLLNLLASSRSVNAARDALQKMGLSVCERDLDSVASGLVEEPV